ncbi:hypothetical protein GC169_09705 [bacterium]|nr:hypothetical protein [bacterium]
MTIQRAAAVVAMVLAVAGCERATDAGVAAETPASAAVEPAPPEAVNGWAEYPLRDGVIRIQPQRWRTDVISIPVPANGGDLEYKLSLKAGDALVYAIDFGEIEHPGLFVSEFHGHTEKRADGVGDLMFYSKDGPPRQNGQFVAPWDGIHGWYLKNESSRDAVVTLEVAGYYEIPEQ